MMWQLQSRIAHLKLMNLCPKFRKPVFLINVHNYWHHENEFFITSRPNRMMDRNGTIRAEYLNTILRQISIQKNFHEQDPITLDWLTFTLLNLTMTYTLRLPKRRSLLSIRQDFLTAQYVIMHTVLDKKNQWQISRSPWDQGFV